MRSRTSRKFGPSWKLTLIQLGRPAAICSRVAGRGRGRRSATTAWLLVERCVRTDGLEPPLQAQHEAAGLQAVENAVIEGQAGGHDRADHDRLLSVAVDHDRPTDHRLGRKNSRLAVVDDRI